MFSHRVLGQRFHALLKVRFDRDDTVPLIFCNILHCGVCNQLTLKTQAFTYVQIIYLNLFVCITSVEWLLGCYKCKTLTGS